MNINGTVLIADDEELACRALATMLNRHFPLLEIEAVAKSGREAIELYAGINPDLVFMDIKMPGISGTEAASHILRNDPSAKIIMLTAYDNFNFAQEAINSGAKAYLLKPINASLLTETVRKVFSSGSSNPHDGASEMLSAYLDTEMVNALTAHTPLWDKIETIDALAGCKLKGGFFILLSGSIPVDETMSLIIESAGRYSYLCAPVYGFIALLVLQEKNSHTPGEEYRITNRIHNRLQRDFPNSFRLAYGKWGEGKEGIRRSFEEGLEILMNRSSPGIHDASDMTQSSHLFSDEDDELMELQDRILHALETGRIGRCREYAGEFVQHLLNFSGNLSSRKERVNEILVMMKRFGIKKQLPDVMQEQILSSLSRIPDQRRLALFMEESITRFLGDENPLGSQETRTLMSAFQYLQEHIFDDISLEQIADISGVSPQYLSLKIKERFGMTFIEYITGKRLEYARYLLLTTNDPIKTVAIHSGYPDANYFSRIFKKNLGQTPVQFRACAGEKKK
jgi:two-component system response regulator YesN